MSVTGGENKIITSGMLGSITALKTEGKVPGKAVDAYTVAQRQKSTDKILFIMF